MRNHNTLRANLTCPHCGEGSLFAIRCEFGDTSEPAAIELGHRYPWVPRKVPHNGGRPPSGNVGEHGYAECARCGLDFFVDIQIANDVVVSASVNVEQPGYKTAVPPGGIVYFCQGEFDAQDPRSDYAYRSWYSKHLIAMGEPALLIGSTPRETYRFLWLRTFHHPLSVTVAESESGAQLRIVELDGQGGYEPGAILASSSKPLAQGSWSALKAALAEAGLWTAAPTVGSTGIDGAQWVLEGVYDGRRAIAHRWSPREGAFREAGLLFLSLAEASPEPIY